MRSRWVSLCSFRWFGRAFDAAEAVQLHGSRSAAAVAQIVNRTALCRPGGAHVRACSRLSLCARLRACACA